MLPPQGQKQREEVVFPEAGSWGQARIWVGPFWRRWDQRPSTVSAGDTTGIQTWEERREEKDLDFPSSLSLQGLPLAKSTQKLYGKGNIVPVI